MLSDHEKKRAARFITQALTERFVVSHALLRDVMSECTGLPPEELVFGEDGLGRPFLDGGGEIDFNLSHTNGMAVVAVARHKLGVDVERFRDAMVEVTDDMLLVDDEAIRRAMTAIERDLGLKVEPAGAVPLAAATTHRERFRDKRLAVVISGSNVSGE